MPKKYVLFMLLLVCGTLADILAKRMIFDHFHAFFGTPGQDERPLYKRLDFPVYLGELAPQCAADLMQGRLSPELQRNLQRYGLQAPLRLNPVARKLCYIATAAQQMYLASITDKGVRLYSCASPSLYLPRDYQALSLIPGCLDIIVSFNRGAVWGSLQGQTTYLTIFSIAALAVILLVLYRTPDSSGLFSVCLGLIAAGALGNLWDRLHFNGVRDFIDMYFRGYHWPTYNLADVWIVCGIAGLMMLELGRGPKNKHQDS